METAGSLTALDLFCGCGGISAGLRDAGFRVLAGIDVEPRYLATFARNFPSARQLKIDLSSISPERLMALLGVSPGELTLVAGGPPCQGFSKNVPRRRRVMDDPNNLLIRTYLEYCVALKPRMVLMENVAEMRNGFSSRFSEEILATLDQAGYAVTHATLNAAEFGVPQRRRRAFFLASRSGRAPRAPAPTHGGSTRQGELFDATAPFVSVWDAIGDLPSLPHGCGEDPSPYACRPFSEYQRKARAGSDEVRNHVARADNSEVRQLDAVLPGGSRITALPANPDTARGFSANVFLDEFAFHQDSRRIWAALFPVISAGHRIRITSTPNGKSNKFYELMTGKGDGWSRHRCDIHQAVAEGLDRNVDEMRAAAGDEELWAQEFELDWADGASAWLPYDLIAAAEHPHAGDPARGGDGSTVVGNDIGRRRDLWVAWLCEEVGDVLWTREIVELRGATFAEQDAALDALLNRWPRTRKVAMDQTGMGEKPVEDAIRRYGASVVEGVLLTGPRRLELATVFRRRIEDRQFVLPAGDRALRTDLHGVKRVAGATGAPRLVVEGDEGADSHSDRFWGGALCAGAAEASPLRYGYRAVNPAAAGGDPRRMRDRPDHAGDRRPRGAAAFAGRLGRLRGAV